MKTALYIYAIVVTGCLCFLGVRYDRLRRSVPEVVEVTRTVRDTVFIKQPEVVRQMFLRVDTVYVPRIVLDTVTLCKSDSMAVAIPIEQKVYEDSTYRAVVSGYRPNLDYMEIYQRNEYVVQTIQPVGNGDRLTPVAIHLGVGVAATPRGVQPCVSVSVGVDLYRFRKRKNERKRK